MRLWAPAGSGRTRSRRGVSIPVLMDEALGPRARNALKSPSFWGVSRAACSGHLLGGPHPPLSHHRPPVNHTGFAGEMDPRERGLTSRHRQAARASHPVVKEHHRPTCPSTLQRLPPRREDVSRANRSAVHLRSRAGRAPCAKPL